MLIVLIPARIRACAFASFTRSRPLALIPASLLTGITG